MKTRLLFIFLTLILISILSLHTFAQEYTQWALPEGAIARFGKGEIAQIKYSQDGTRLAVASGVGIWIYDTSTYQEVDLLTGHTALVKGVAFSPDGKTIVSGSENSTIQLWDVDIAAYKVTLIGHPEPVKCVTFSPDGKTIASGGEDSEIRLWNAHTGELERTLSGHTLWVISVAFSPDGNTIASGGWEGNIHLWDAETGAHKKTFTGHTSWVNSIAFSPDGKTLVSGSRDCSVLLWELNPSTSQDRQ